jgi:E3 ubiquitin-protein ligase makorin
MRYVHREAEQFRLLDAHRSGLIRQLESVFDGGMDDNALIRQRLEILMLAPFTGEDPHSGSESPSDEEEDDDGMPPLERIGGNRAADWPLPLMFDSSDSEAAESDADDDEDDRYSSTLETGDAPYDRMQTVRPFDLVFDPSMDARDAASNRGVFMRLRSFLDDMAHSDAGPSTSTPAESSARAVDSAVPDPPALVDAADEEDAGDEYDMPPLTPLEYEPPFVTDGRGRVVWSSSSDSGAGDSHQTSSSGLRRGSVSFPGACPSASPAEKTSSPRQTPSDDASRPAAREGGFTTDGRGRVIGTTGTREGEQDENADEESSTISDEAPIPSRSFFGRVLTAFF